VKGLFQP